MVLGKKSVPIVATKAVASVLIVYVLIIMRLHLKSECMYFIILETTQKCK